MLGVHRQGGRHGVPSVRPHVRVRALRNQLGAVPALPGQVSDDQGVPHMTSVGQSMCVRPVAVISVAIETMDSVH